jgi:3-hydroxymyristoyl/3-hydroxydecanoyl-(acyl carrier protein) dehydratase
MRLPQVKFLQPLLPGEVARVELEGASPRWKFRVLRGEALLASGDVAEGPA